MPTSGSPSTASLTKFQSCCLLVSPIAQGRPFQNLTRQCRRKNLLLFIWNLLCMSFICCYFPALLEQQREGRHSLGTFNICFTGFCHPFLNNFLFQPEEQFLPDVFLDWLRLSNKCLFRPTLFVLRWQNTHSTYSKFDTLEKQKPAEQKLFSFNQTTIFLTAYILSQNVRISRIIKETRARRASTTLETSRNWQTACRVRAVRQWVQILGHNRTPQGFFLVLHRLKDSSVPCLRKLIMVCCSQLKILDWESSFRPLMPSSIRPVRELPSGTWWSRERPTESLR